MWMFDRDHSIRAKVFNSKILIKGLVHGVVLGDGNDRGRHVLRLEPVKPRQVPKLRNLPIPDANGELSVVGDTTGFGAHVMNMSCELEIWTQAADNAMNRIHSRNRFMLGYMLSCIPVTEQA
jgi:hypothetical protein